MNWRARGRVTVIAGLLALTLALAACAPTATVKTGAGSAGGASDAPPLSPIKTYPTVTPTATPAPPAPDCQAGQLATQFGMGSPATGNLTGSILARNVSATACSMEGAESFYGIDAQGNHVTRASPEQPYTLARVVLPPRTPAVTTGAEATPGAYLEILVLGAYRDDTTGAAPDGMCAYANEVTPAWFVVSIGSVTMRVANYSPYPGLGTLHTMEGCQGAIFAGDASLSQ